MSPAIPAGRFKLLPLYDAINSVFSWHPNAVVRLSNTGYRALRHFWTQLVTYQCVVTWDPTTPNETLFTDASDFGLGAHTSHISTPSSVVSGLWNKADAARHITFKELKVVQIALEALGPMLRHRRVALFSDSSSTVSILQRLYTKSVALRNVLGRIIALLSSLNVQL